MAQHSRPKEAVEDNAKKELSETATPLLTKATEVAFTELPEGAINPNALREAVQNKLIALTKPHDISVEVVTLDVSFQDGSDKATFETAAVVRKDGIDALVHDQSWWLRGVEASRLPDTAVLQAARQVRSMLMPTGRMDGVKDALAQLGLDKEYQVVGSSSSQSGWTDGTTSTAASYTIADGHRVLSTEGYQAQPVVHKATVKVDSRDIGQRVSEEL